MNGLFAPDSRFMRYLNRFADLMILNLLFLLTSIPIFTIGASLTALYSVCFHLGTDREGSTFRDYFAAFKENCRQATARFLLLLLWLMGTGGAAVIFCFMAGWMHYLFVPFAVLFIVVVLVASYVFPLLSRFDNQNTITLKNAALLSLGYLPRSIIIGAINLFPFVLLAVDLLAFLKAGFAWLIIWFSAAAYCNCLLLKKVFAPYLEEKKDDHSQDET